MFRPHGIPVHRQCLVKSAGKDLTSIVEGSALPGSPAWRATKGADWACARCGDKRHEVGKLRATGGFFSKLFDVQTRRFITVSCLACGYTELYRQTGAPVEDLTDFLVGG
jgi:predicted nucleic-acid-binding Zn-ribbon protein